LEGIIVSLKIIEEPHVLLKEICEPVKVFDQKLKQLLAQMHGAMVDSDGIGLAAPQVGEALRICLVTDDEEDKTYELINPEMIESSGNSYEVEGCLSVPGMYGYVNRFETIKISAQDASGKPFILEAKDYFARTIQHEMDHLDGILFTEKVDQYLTEEELLDLQIKDTRIVFMGTPDFSVPILDRLVEEGYNVVAVVTQPDRPVGRKKVLTAPPVKQAALKHDIPVLQPEKIREQVELEALFAYEPDLIITAAFGQILPKELLDFPEFGCINVHASLLPELRGGAPIHYALIEGKEKTGITIMYMAERLDAGDIIGAAELPIDETDHTGILHEKLSLIGAQLLIDTLPQIILDEIQPIVQDEAHATFARNIKREQEIIDWSKAGEEIYNHIRGLHPWPVAYTTIAGEVMKVWWGEKYPVETSKKPGEILSLTADGVIVSTGNATAIKLTDVQLAGKKRSLVKNILNGKHPFAIDQVLGE